MMDENDINELSESERRFILDLEFVQCLSNVGYLKCMKVVIITVPKKKKDLIII